MKIKIAIVILAVLASAFFLVRNSGKVPSGKKKEKVMYYDDVSKIDISYTDKGLIESYVFVSEVGKTFPVYPGDFPNGELEDIIAKID